jgi:antitoxin (DNA-binding transcriptional repressor) of toxin-antitoxin stability system
MQNIQTISTKELRDNLSEILEKVAVGGQSFVVYKFGRKKAILNPVISATVLEARKEAKPFRIAEFKKYIKDIKPKKLIPRSKREEVYRKHMMEKYGKGIS